MGGVQLAVDPDELAAGSQHKVQAS